MKQIPMCWKCASAITELGKQLDSPGSHTLTGCKECKEIESYQDAKELCPLIKENKMKPYICPNHPTAQIRHEYNQNHYVLNSEAAGIGYQSNHNYFCAECGLELCSELEHLQRKKDMESCDGSY